MLHGHADCTVQPGPACDDGTVARFSRGPTGPSKSMDTLSADAMSSVTDRPRVLFVDDEVGVLDGLRRMLRGRRGDWEMSFAVGGQEALDSLQAARADVVVTDMRMPGIDGLALLTFLHEHHPDVVRIVLSGQCDEKAAMKALPLVHRFLSKPCDPDALFEAVTTATETHKRLHSPLLRQLLGRMDALPSPPGVVVSLNDALMGTDEPISAISDIISGDVAMSAQVLRLVNSALFGLQHHVSDIDRAVTLLGTNTIRDLAVSASAFRAFAGGAAVGHVVHEVQAHSLAVAALAPSLVATELRPDTFIAALLHDVGVLVLAAQMPDELKHAQKQLKLGLSTVQETEEGLWGAGHAEIGGVPTVAVGDPAVNGRGRGLPPSAPPKPGTGYAGPGHPIG